MLTMVVGVVLVSVMAMLSWWSTTVRPETGHVERVLTFGESQGQLLHTHQFPPTG